MIRTSYTHPLAIDEVACGPGAIGMTFCPSKKGESVHGEAWDRDLGLDLERIRHWRPDAIVTLMETHEFDRLGAPELPEAMEALGALWIHLPIVDVSTPDETFERRWMCCGHILRGLLRRGGRVLAHCRGGLGRTGMIAARLLIEFGVAPGAAISAVRAARPGAIETPAQKLWVRQLEAPALDDHPAGRLLGCLLGGAVGDAFGYEVEFSRLSEIHRRHGSSGLIDPVLRGGRLVVSDDTQMTLFTADGLWAAPAGGAVDDEQIVEAIRRAYLDWYTTQQDTFPAEEPFADPRRFRELWVRRDPGLTCQSALACGGGGSPASPINDSKGCGGVMRVAPIGLVESIPSDRAFALAAHAAALTHGHPSGYLSAAAMAGLVRDLFDGEALDTAIARTFARLAARAHHEETSAKLRAAIDLAGSSLSAPEAIHRLGGGWVGEEALAIAVYSVLSAADFADVVRIAANHNGDSDSTASIAGQIWGVMYGLDAVPAKWVIRLDVLDAACEAARRLMTINKSAN